MSRLSATVQTVMDASGGRAARTRLGMALRAAEDCHADGARAARVACESDMAVEYSLAFLPSQTCLAEAGLPVLCEKDRRVPKAVAIWHICAAFTNHDA